MPQTLQPISTTSGSSIDATFERWKKDLASGRLFEFAGASSAGRRGHSAGFKAHDSRTSRLLQELGELALHCRPLMPVCLGIARAINPHSSTAEFEAKTFLAAADLLDRPYVDTEKLSGPEPGRRKDATRDFSPWEKFLVLETLSRLTDGYACTGWAAQRYAEESGRISPAFWRMPARSLV